MRAPRSRGRAATPRNAGARRFSGKALREGSVLSSKVELRAEELTVRYAQWVLRWRWPIIVLTLLASAVTAYGFRYFVLDNDYRVFFSHDDPKLLDYEALQNAYT